MNKSYRIWLGSALIAAAIPLAAASTVDAHPSVILRNSAGAPVGQNEPYSPKMTCMSQQAQLGFCHHNGLDLYGSGQNADGTPNPAGIHEVHKTQGVLDKDGLGNVEIYWQSYSVDANNHGTVIGRHSQQGRNEEYSITMKTVFKDAFFTSSPGMFGKY